MARAVAGALALSVSCSMAMLFPADLGAQTPTLVAVGEMDATHFGDATRAALETAMRTALESRSDVRVAGDARRARWVLRGSVTQLERREVGEETEVRCAVSVIVADARGNVRAMLSGRAGARGGHDVHALERSALSAAVRGALRPLGTELRAH